MHPHTHIEGSQTACIECGGHRTLVNQYREAEGLDGPVVVRRFVCLPCYDALPLGAKLFDQSFKAQSQEESPAKTHVAKRSLPKVPKQVTKTTLTTPPEQPVAASPARKLLDYILKQSRKGNARQGIQHVLEVTDDWMREARWGDCGALLNDADPAQFSVTMSLGLLAACYPCRALTKEPRQRFIEALRTHLSRTRPQDMEILMQGLEGP